MRALGKRKLEASAPVSLLEKLRQPDQAEAWQRFVELYTPLLYDWSRRTGLASNEAADLVQNVFLVLVQKRRASNASGKAAFAHGCALCSSISGGKIIVDVGTMKRW